MYCVRNNFGAQCMVYEEVLTSFIALERMNVDEKIKNMIKALCKNQKCKVETEGKASNWYRQETGIRQGCPSSPYLFLIVMEVIFHDIHENDKLKLEKFRVNGSNVDDVLFADDAILMSENKNAIQRLLHEIEEGRGRYGFKLNK